MACGRFPFIADFGLRLFNLDQWVSVPHGRWFVLNAAVAERFWGSTIETAVAPPANASRQ
jgi:hypothetical protein